MDELLHLEDILESIVPSEHEMLHSNEFKQAVFDVVEEYIGCNILTMMNEDFHETLLNDVFHLMICQFEDDLKFYNYEECECVIDDIIHEYYSDICNARSCDDDDRSGYTLDNVNVKKHIQKLETQLSELKAQPQPQQRTKEWYSYRYNLLTASNAYKAFMTGSEYNQLIYEKCQPLVVPSNPTQEDADTCVPVNVDTTLHWGQKYEEVSVMIYEDMYKTKIEEFGCIQHPTIPFLGASPDGINMDQTNTEFYGRMLEIKNIVNRDITGVPKTEYWVQMQLQMEACDLNECDFFETRIKEYDNEQQYVDAVKNKSMIGVCVNNSRNNASYGGVVMHFSKNGKPIYKYSPLNIAGDALKEWEENMREEMDNSDGVLWIKNMYWYLEEYSCVLVLRNKTWFDAALPLLQSAWDTITKERVEGYQHRAPAKRSAKKTDESDGGSSCMIRLNNALGNVVVNDGTITSCFQYNNIPIKIRTESIDETSKKMSGAP